MAFLQTTYEKKSFWTTAFILLAVLLILFFAGLRYLDPPQENGILIAFGNTDPGNSLTLAPPIQAAKEETIVPEMNEAPEVKEVLVEEVVSEALEDVLTTADSELVLPKKLAEKAAETVPEKIPEKVIQQASAATKAALANILGAKEAQGSGIGNDGKSANQGLSDGSKYANSFYGSTTGEVQGFGFGLAGRSLASKGSVTPDCNEEGRVVVAITVDRSGKVIAADPGVKGSTNNAPCLLAPAKATAFMYQWAPDAEAPEKQIGFVVINFKLGGQQ
ncbi:energy transducer TonB [Flavobacteriaceae bacterium]|nr:energy transducer TonB [Flavobacteriaceae bacterium]MDC1364315.1 energy transducer TonB [Flavobacteriaceae bacterium]